MMEEREDISTDELLNRARAKILFIEEVMLNSIKLDLRATSDDITSSREGLGWILGDISHDMYMLEKMLDEERAASKEKAGGAA